MTTNTTKTWTPAVTSILVSDGLDECGTELNKVVWFLTLDNAFGDRYSSVWSSASEAAAVARQAVVEAALAHGASPVASDRWVLHHPVYGSAAYAAYGEAEEVAWEAEMDGR
jgi:hypothetical protein